MLPGVNPGPFRVKLDLSLVEWRLVMGGLDGLRETSEQSDDPLLLESLDGLEVVFRKVAFPGTWYVPSKVPNADDTESEAGPRR